MLAKRSAQIIWKHATENVDLPSCPRDLNEMQYIRLLFDNHECDVSCLLSSVFTTLTLASLFCDSIVCSGLRSLRILFGTTTPEYAKVAVLILIGEPFVSPPRRATIRFPA